MNGKKRLTAKKVRILDIVNGKYFPGNVEEMSPSYIITPLGQKISRVNLIATVIDKFLSEDENYSTITVDDGTGAIRVKFFGENALMLKNIEVGDLVLIIGKIKEYNNEIYANGEIVRKIEDKNYEIVRKLEILKELMIQKKIIEKVKTLAERISTEELKKRFEMDEESLKMIVENKHEAGYKTKILELINNLSNKDGIEINKIFELTNLPENVVEDAINELLDSGQIFEPRPGVLKACETNERNL